jgi:hypothetical protein
LDLILEGPEDDLVRVETCCPKNNDIIKSFVVFDILYSTFVCKHFEIGNIKKKNKFMGWQKHNYKCCYANDSYFCVSIMPANSLLVASEALTN